MKIDNLALPHSSFLSVEKDMGIIFREFIKNKRLMKLLYYNTPDALDKPDVPKEEVAKMFGKQIKIVPKLEVNNELFTYVIISFDNFTPNATNPEFRDNIVEFDIICHFDQWHLKDFELRPYRIAAEIDTMLQEKRLTGIGETEFLGANQMILSDEIAGICLLYGAIHGEEDKKFMPNPANEEQFIKDFNELYN